MKALSIQQPWAALIVHGRKPIENRSWWTSYRGRFLVHTGKAFDREAFSILRDLGFDVDLSSESLPVGGIVGAATLIAVVTHHRSKWFFGPYGFVLDDPTPLPFKPCRGQLGFFETGLTEADLRAKSDG